MPWLKKHQTLIDEKTIPDQDEKLEIFLQSREQFLKSGYQAIAMDHFALKEDDLAKSVETFFRQDATAAQRLIESDDRVNEQRESIVMDCLALSATQQPTASDLRLLAAHIHVVDELERIHDYVKGISGVVLARSNEEIPEAVQSLFDRMIGIVDTMLHDALSAYGAVDVDAARQIPLGGKEVGVLYREGSIVLALSVADDTATFQKWRTLQQVINYLERTADRAINICEWTIYLDTGRYVEAD